MLSFSSGLAAALGLVSSQTEWVTTLINTLGATRTLECKRATTNTDVWADGTTFLQAALIGPMSGSGAFVTGFGSVGAAVVQEAADLATGYSVLRISGGGEWVQGTLGLTGSGADFTLRASPAANTGFGFGSATTISAPANLPLTPPGALVTTLTLLNPKTTATPAYTVVPMTAHSFVQGDIPAGQDPQFFLENGTKVDATIYLRTTWPDGSLQWCGLMLGVPASIPASSVDYSGFGSVNYDQNSPGIGKLTLQVKNGGSPHGISGRSLSDFTAANISMEVTGVSGLSGTWVAGLNDAIATGQATKIADGPVGAIWRIQGDFKQAGAPHGQVMCYHFAAALQNQSGGLLGIMYLGRVAQPWGDVVSPPATLRSMSAQLKTGSTVVRTFQGSRWVNPADTSLGETLSSQIDLPYYAGFYTAGEAATYDFFQSGGSASSLGEVLVVHDREYFVATEMLPSYSTTLQPTSGASVNYNPMGRGSMERKMGTTGERDDIGVLPTWAVRHAMTGSARDARICRVNGLASGGWRQCARKKSTGQIVPVVDVSPTYTGLGPVEKFWRGPVAYVYGFTAPTDNSSIWMSEYEPSHRPDGAYYPYLFTGEPQYLDLLHEHAAGIISGVVTESRTMTMSLPVTSSTITANGDYGDRDVQLGASYVKGGGYLFYGGLTRVTAWGSRDIAHAAALSPDVCPYGTQVKKYFRELCDAMFGALNTYNAALGPDWSGAGIYCFDNRADAAAPWCSGYFSNSVCHQSKILASPVIAATRSFVAQFWEKLAQDRDLASVFSFDGGLYNETGLRVSSIEQFVTSVSTPLTFSTSDSRFTVGAGSNWSAWQPTNGDIVCFYSGFSGNKPFAEALDLRRFYVVNASGYSAQLSLTPGGSPVTVTSGVTVGKFFARIQNFAPNVTAESIGPSTYIANITSAIRHHAACGDSVPTALAEANAKFSASGISFVGNPKNAIAATYPGV